VLARLWWACPPLVGLSASGGLARLWWACSASGGLARLWRETKDGKIRKQNIVRYTRGNL